jgi:hypothetical protein
MRLTPKTINCHLDSIRGFYNYVIHEERVAMDHEPESANPCDAPMIRKLYRKKVAPKWEIIEKKTIDEIIFRKTKKPQPFITGIDGPRRDADRRSA